jgi:hypothetical protein
VELPTLPEARRHRSVAPKHRSIQRFRRFVGFPFGNDNCCAIMLHLSPFQE